MQGKNSLDALSALASVDCPFKRFNQPGLVSEAASFSMDIVGVSKVQRQGGGASCNGYMMRPAKCGAS